VLAVTALAVGLCSSAQAEPAAPVPNDYGDVGQQPTPAAPVVTAEAAAGSIEVTVTTSGSTVEGVAFTRSSVHKVAPVCWYGRGMTGQEYFEYWKPGGVARQSGTLDAYAAQGLLYPGYEAYATDAAGHWYDAVCRFDAPADQATAYRASHPAVFVLASQPVPAAQADVAPAVLAQVAFEAMDLPHGVIRWNPTLEGSGATVVNMDTWVWVEGAPTTVSVTAQVPSGTWAQVDATLDHLDLTAPGADPVSCNDNGVAWAKGATSTSCSIVFYHSSANQPVKTGQTLPTVTLTATGSWTATWFSSLDPTRAALPPAQDLTTTTEIPVAEIQALVTLGS